MCQPDILSSSKMQLALTCIRLWWARLVRVLVCALCVRARAWFVCLCVPCACVCVSVCARLLHTSSCFGTLPSY